MVPPPTITDYASAEQWLLSITDYERLLGSPAVRYDTQNFDLVRFREQLQELGDPHLRYGVIHVAGTKGKGSTCALLESAFRACGYKTGLYTSPHLHKFTERIQVNGAAISDADFARLVEQMGARMAPAGEAQSGGAAGFRTVFEILTAAAFAWFAEERVDVAIIETGLGGRLDSTNMFDRASAGPLVNVITPIGLDHTSILGNTVEAIAGEKAGIIRPHSHVVVSRQPDPETAAAVREVVARRCADVGAGEPLYVEDVMEVTPGSAAGCYFMRWKGDRYPGKMSHCWPVDERLLAGEQVCLSLRGEHQAQNAAAAMAALILYQRAECAGGGGSRLTFENIAAGMANTRWAGRFQVGQRDGIDVVVDGAHCAMSAAALGRACHQEFGDKPVALVVGFLRDKAGSEILDGVFGAVPVQAAVAIAPPTPRAAGTDHIYTALQSHLPVSAIHRADDIDSAMAQAVDAAKQLGGYVVVYGSLYLAGPALEWLHETNP
jgi:dihydrofolate synthase/folylpolyglutamate synthase